MKKYAAVLSLLTLTTPFAHAMTEVEMAGFCEDKFAEYGSYYQKNVAALEAKSKTIKDLGAEVLDLIKPGMAASLNSKGRYNSSKSTTMEKIKNYRNEVNNVQPKTLQNNANYLDEMFSKHGIEDTFRSGSWWDDSLFYHAENSIKQAFGEYSDVTSQFKRFISKNLAEYSVDTDNVKRIDAFVRLGKTLELPLSSIDGEDLSGRKLNRKSVIQMRLTEDGIEASLKNSETVFSQPTKSETEYKEEQIKAVYPECAQHLGIK